MQENEAIGVWENAQHEALKTFRKECEDRGLFETFDDTNEFR